MPFYTKSELLQVLDKLGITLDKNRGQCFLVDENFVNFIIGQLDDSQKNIESLLEIGSGLGTLSDKLVQKAEKTVFIDNDKKIIQFLRDKLKKKYPDRSIQLIDFKKEDQTKVETKINRPYYSKKNNVLLINGDILEIPFPNVDKIIGNIPYQISAPLIFKLIHEWNFQNAILMVQKEFAKRLTANVNSSDYSRVSAATNLFLDIEVIRNVNRNCFYPVPRVTSSLISIYPKNTLDQSSVEFQLKTDYLDFLRGVLAYKNKNLKNCIKYYFEREENASDRFPHLAKMIHNKKERKKYPIFREKLRSLAPKTIFQVMKYGVQGDEEDLLLFE